MYTPPGAPRSRSLTRFTMRVGFEHLGQSVLLVVSISFLRSPVFAIFAMMFPISFRLGIRVTSSSAHFFSHDSPPHDCESNPIEREMSGRIGPDTSQSSRESLPTLVYTKPRGYGVSWRSGGWLSDGPCDKVEDVGGVESCAAGLAVPLIVAIWIKPALGASDTGADAAAGGAGCIG